LFIDARKLGRPDRSGASGLGLSRPGEDHQHPITIGGSQRRGEYDDVPGFLGQIRAPREIAAHGTCSRQGGMLAAEEVKTTAKPFEVEDARLGWTELEVSMRSRRSWSRPSDGNLRGLGYGG